MTQVIKQDDRTTHVINGRLLLKHHLKSEWDATYQNIILMHGELGFEFDTQRFKIGDGETAWKDLTYAIESKTAIDLAEGSILQIVKGGTGVNNFPIAGYVKANGLTPLTSVSTIPDSDVEFFDVTTGNSSTSKHGFLPKLEGDTTKYLRSDGNWILPPDGYTSSTSWNNGTSAGPTLTFVRNRMDSITSPAIPIATSTQSGVITTTAQTIKGVKTFSDGIIGNITGNATSADKVNHDIKIYFDNGSTENTDLFTFDGSSAKSVKINAGTCINLVKNATNGITINSSEPAYTPLSTNTSFAKLKIPANITITSDATGHLTALSVTQQDMQVASSTLSGILSNTDWTTFNNKANVDSQIFTGTPQVPDVNDTSPSTQIVNKKYVDELLTASNAMVFKGVIASNSELPQADYHVGWAYIVSTAGTYAGVVCEPGDYIICTTAYSSSFKNSDWSVIQTNINGAVTGPSSAVNNHIAVFDGTTGKVIKDSSYTIQTSVPANAVFTDTHWTSSTIAGASATATSNAAVSTNGSLYLNHIENSVVRSSHKITGAHSTLVTSDASGNITIDSQYLAGTGLTLTDITFNHTDNVEGGAATWGNTTAQQLTYGGTFTIPIATYNATGHITKVETKTLTLPASDNTDTHWTSGTKVSNSATSLTDAASSNGSTYINHIENGAIRSSHKIVGSGITTVVSDSSGVITINSPDTNTHWTANLISAASNTATSNAASTTGNQVYLNLIENSTVRNSHLLSTTGISTLTSDASGNITINTPDTNTDYQVKSELHPELKGYLTGTESSSTSTGTLIFDNAVYLGTSAGSLYATNFYGTLTGSVIGNVTGNVSGSSGSCTGNSATATRALSVGTDATIKLYAQNSNEINFGGTASLTEIVFGKTSVDSRPVPVTYTFGENSSAAVNMNSVNAVSGVFSGNVKGQTVNVGNAMLQYDETNKVLNFVFE